MKQLKIKGYIKDTSLNHLTPYYEEYNIKVLTIEGYDNKFVDFAGCSEGMIAVNKKSALELSNWFKKLSEELKE